MSNENFKPEDLQDHFLERALYEVVGGETPPDLSEKIMLAATGESDRKKVTRAAADQAYLREGSQKRQGANIQRNQRIGIAIAACVLVGSLIVFPISLATLESPNQVQPIAKLEETDSAAPADRKERLNFNAYGEDADFIAMPEASDGSEPANQDDLMSRTLDESQPQSAPAAEQSSNDDLAALSVIPDEFQSRNSTQEWETTTGRRAVKERRKRERANELQLADGTIVELPAYESVPVDSIVQVDDNGAVVTGGSKKVREFGAESKNSSQPKLMMGTTPRIIIQEEEEALVLDADGVVEESGGRPGLAGQGGQQAMPALSAAPESLRRPAAASDIEARYALAVPQTAPVEGSPGQDNPRHEFWGYYRTPNAGPATPASPQAEPDQLALQRGYLSKGEGFGVPQENKPALVARKQEIKRQLLAKMDAYHDLSAEIGGATDPAANSKVNLLVGEVREIQAEIQKQKEDLLNQTVNLQLIQKKATRPAALEKDVAEALAADEVLERYRAKNFAYKQKIKELTSTSMSGSSAQIRRLQSSLAALEQEAQEYRENAEREIRAEMRKTPEPSLAVAKSKYVLSRRNTELELARLNREYETKIEAIERLSEDAKLDTLQAEIEELSQALEAGRGPDASGDKYARIHENPFVKAEGEKAVSTFSIDVDTASYANVRQFLMQSGQLPPPDAVRIEELVNYFDYDYTPPTDDTPFASHVEVAGCPWKAGHRLVRVGIKGREIDTKSRPQSNLVFLVDVSGSMNEPAKLPLLVDGMKMLTRELGENDRIAIVVYASSEGLALPSTRGDQQDKILSTLDNLRAGGSTAGGAGIELAYEIAEKNFIKGGVNRVILATDGDFNVGLTDEGGLTRLAEEKAKDSGVFLTVLGFGRGNLNDSMMEKISNAGNGNYHYVDNTTEARKVLVAEMAGTLVTIAKDVKIQIEFNPVEVAAYRLIGYENRMLKTEVFNDDKKDAGEIGAGHTVTAIYEVIPAGQPVDVPAVDPLKYQQPATATPGDDDSGEMLTLKLRYKQPDEDVSTKLEFPITDNGQSFAKATPDFKFASAVASFGMLLRHSQHQGLTSYNAVEEIANDGIGKDEHGYRAEFLQLVRRAKQLAGE